MIVQQSRATEARFFAQVFGHDRLVGLERVASLRVHASAHRCTADEPFVPTHPGAQQRCISFRQQLQHLAVFDVEGARDFRNRAVEQLLQIILAQRKQAELSHRTLLPHLRRERFLGAFAAR